MGDQFFPVWLRFRMAMGSVLYWCLARARDVFLAFWRAVAVAGALVLIALLTESDPQTSLIPSQPAQREAVQREPVPRELAFTNVLGAYGFSYPSNWGIWQAGVDTELESPDGDAVLSFSRRRGLWGEDTSTGLLEWMSESLSSPVVVGTTWERIGGVQSLLLSGTGRDFGGRRVKFLAIAIPGQRPKHQISVVVHADSDPSLMLGRVEAIVTSFEILRDGKISQMVGQWVSGSRQRTGSLAARAAR